MRLGMPGKGAMASKKRGFAGGEGEERIARVSDTGFADALDDPEVTAGHAVC
jgi:hypothetical protein